MRSSNSKFDERGHDAQTRDIEELAIQLTDLGVEAEGFSSALAAQTQQTFSAIDQGIADHVAQSNPHPQYLLISNYSAGFTPTFVRAIGSTTTAGTATGTATIVYSSSTGSLTGMNTATGIFTAPATGTYIVTCAISAYGYSDALNLLSTMVTLTAGTATQDSWTFHPYINDFPGGSGSQSQGQPHHISIPVSLTVGDTAFMSMTWSGGSSPNRVRWSNAMLSAIRLS